MARRASIAVTVRVAHKPSDGMTPVVDPATGKWVYDKAPTLEKLDATREHLEQYNTKIAAAELKADTAAESVGKMQLEVDAKVDADGAAQASRNQLFVVEDEEGNELLADALRFVGGPSGFTMQLCVYRTNATTGRPDPAMGYCARLDYAFASDVRDLEKKVAELEERLAALESKINQTKNQ